MRLLKHDNPIKMEGPMWVYSWVNNIKFTFDVSILFIPFGDNETCYTLYYFSFIDYKCVFGTLFFFGKTTP